MLRHALLGLWAWLEVGMVMSLVYVVRENRAQRPLPNLFWFTVGVILWPIILWDFGAAVTDMDRAVEAAKIVLVCFAVCVLIVGGGLIIHVFNGGGPVFP